MDLQLLYAQWKLGELPSEQLPSVAGELMVSGHQGPAVLRLVSFHRPSRDELKDAPERVLEELGLSVPSEIQCVFLLAQQVARNIIQGNLRPKLGADRVSLWVQKVGGYYWPRGAKVEGCERVDKEVFDLLWPILYVEDMLEPPEGRDKYLVDWAWRVLEYTP